MDLTSVQLCEYIKIIKYTGVYNKIKYIAAWVLGRYCISMPQKAMTLPEVLLEDTSVDIKKVFPP